MPTYALEQNTPDLAGSTQSNDKCWIADDADIIGKVIMEKDTSVWFGAVLRGDNEPITIGAGSNLQEMVMCHTDPGFPLTVGKDCTIGHKALLHGCTIGDNTLIGMGAMVMNGAKVGNNCLVGAGALIPEGKEIPDGSLVIGVPGKVVRQLDDGAISGLTMSAKAYQANASRFRDKLKKL